jgi:hypothetical protein
MAGDITFFSLPGPVGDYTGALLWFFVGFFWYIISQKEQRGYNGRSRGEDRGGGHYFFWVPNSLEGCDGWGGEYYKASVVQWIKIRPWRPEFGPEGKHFVTGNSYFLFLGEQRSCDGPGGAQRPVGRGNESKRTGARSARARKRGQNPLVIIYCCKACVLSYWVPDTRAGSRLGWPAGGEQRAPPSSSTHKEQNVIGKLCKHWDKTFVWTPIQIPISLSTFSILIKVFYLYVQ